MRALAKPKPEGTRSREIAPKLHAVLQELSDRLPDSEDKEQLETWWQENGKTWTQDLRIATIEYRNIGHNWQFSQKQQKLLWQYYEANQLLSHCLYSDCYASREVREGIEATMFLPIAAL